MASTSNSLLISLLVLVAVGGTWFLAESSFMRTSEPEYALRLPDPAVLPDFELLDQDGRPLTNAWFNDKWTLVFFGFTHCPDICPATLQVLSLARQRMAVDDPERELPDILLISVDPDRDTPGTLKQYVGHFGDGVSGATGQLEELRKLTQSIGIYFEKEEPAETDDADSGAANYGMAHSAHVVVIDELGRYNAVFSAPHKVDEFVADVPLLMRAN